MHVPQSNLKAQFEYIRAGFESEFLHLLESSAYIGGQAVQNFETEFADYLGAGQVIGVGNGTDALEILIEALDLPPRSEVLVPAHSFVATAEAVVRSGHEPVFVDVDDNFFMSLEDADKKLTARSGLLVVVHMWGRLESTRAVADFAKAHGLKVIEDCAQAHGLFDEGFGAGTLFDGGAYSFYPGKNLGGLGDGGAVVLPNSAEALLGERVRRISNHGRLRKFDHDVVGRNSRLDAVQALVLKLKLRLLDEWVDKRRAIASFYEAGMSGNAAIRLYSAAPAKHVFHQFVVGVENRDGLREALAEEGIETGVHYPESIPELLAFGGSSEVAPRAARLTKQIVSLPIAESLTLEQVTHVVDSVLSSVER